MIDKESIEAFKHLSEPISNVLNPPSKIIGEFLGNLTEYVLKPYNDYFKAKNIMREKAFEDFQKEIKDKASSIPQENITMPKIEIVGPILEASKYYLGEKELRNIFSNLLISSIDKTKAPKVLPIFTDIIQKLTPLDAQNLKLFAPDHTENDVIIFKTRPIARLCAYENDDRTSLSVIFDNIFLCNQNMFTSDDLKKQSISLSTLHHLGLINISFDNQTSRCDYKCFENNEIIDFFQKELNDCLVLYKGCCSVTPLGQDFILTCL